MEWPNCYYPFQFDFRLNYPTKSTLITPVENMQTQLDKCEFATGVYVDLRQAIDTVDHSILEAFQKMIQFLSNKKKSLHQLVTKIIQPIQF